MTRATEVRLALKAAGCSPSPCQGKKPTLHEWQTKSNATAEEITTWGGSNSGILTRFNPAWDTDVLDPDPASATEEMLRDWFDGRGKILVRTSNPPKRAILLRTSQPFGKPKVSFIGPNGNCQPSEHRNKD